MIDERLSSTMDFFSIGLLVRTMFSLFRQDGAGSVNGPLSVKIQAMFGRLISRFIGALIRSVVLVIGLFVITFQAITGGLVLAVWAFVPMFPLVGFVLMVSGWMPWR